MRIQNSQTSKFGCLTKKVNYFCKALHFMFDRVMNISLDYLSYFTVVLRWIHRHIYIYQTYSTPYKLEFSHYSKVIHGSKTFKLTKGQRILKKHNCEFIMQLRKEKYKIRLIHVLFYFHKITDVSSFTKGIFKLL